MLLRTQEKLELRRQLERRRDALAEEVHNDVERSRAETVAGMAGGVHDRGEESVAGAVVEANHADLARDLRELGMVEAALRRLERGTYGTCMDCGEDIALERLRAEPAAVRCTGCQRRYED